MSSIDGLNAAFEDAEAFDGERAARILTSMLVEEQRIANLIAYANTTSSSVTRTSALNAARRLLTDEDGTF